MVSEEVIYQEAEEMCRYYNSAIWNVFYVGIGFSLILLYIFWTRELSIFIQWAILFLGLFTFFYSTILIESMGEKKNHYRDWVINHGNPLKDKEYLHISSWLHWGSLFIILIIYAYSLGYLILN